MPAATTRVVALSAAAFDAALAAHAGGAGVLLVLFTGSSDAAGVSWCPDCNDSKPALEAALRGAEEPVTLITVPLPRSEYSGNAAHWARCVGAPCAAVGGADAERRTAARIFVSCPGIGGCGT